MQTDYVKVGYLQTNCYILSIGNECIVIDPGDEFTKIKDKIMNKKVIGIIVTHYHFDHIGALKELENYTKAKVYDIQNLKEGINIIGAFTFETIYTKGHKEDSISIYFPKEKLLFCGDFIFQGTIGRCDLPGGNFSDMQKSIKRILKYNDNIKIFPGHGELTSMKDERENLEYWLHI